MSAAFFDLHKKLPFGHRNFLTSILPWCRSRRDVQENVYWPLANERVLGLQLFGALEARPLWGNYFYAKRTEGVEQAGLKSVEGMVQPG